MYHGVHSKKHCMQDPKIIPLNEFMTMNISIPINISRPFTVENLGGADLNPGRVKLVGGDIIII